MSIEWVCFLSCHTYIPHGLTDALILLLRPCTLPLIYFVPASSPDVDIDPGEYTTQHGYGVYSVPDANQEKTWRRCEVKF